MKALNEKEKKLRLLCPYTPDLHYSCKKYFNYTTEVNGNTKRSNNKNTNNNYNILSNNNINKQGEKLYNYYNFYNEKRKKLKNDIDLERGVTFAPHTNTSWKNFKFKNDFDERNKLLLTKKMIMSQASNYIQKRQLKEKNNNHGKENEIIHDYLKYFDEQKDEILQNKKG